MHLYASVRVYVYCCARCAGLQEGKFSESLGHCDAVFAMVPLVVVNSKTLAADVKTLLRVATEYKLVLRIVTTAKSHDQADAVRQVELGAYMTHCQLELPHHMLVMNMAMAMAFKFKNFITAASIARRLLEIPDINSAKNATLQQKVRVSAAAAMFVRVRLYTCAVCS